MMDWEKLLNKAFSCIDYAEKMAGQATLEWSFGGGTAMMQEYHHRKSKDIDIFLRDVQFLSMFSPRLSDAAEDVSESYDEQSNYVKIYTKEGEIDFIIAARLTQSPVVNVELLGRSILMETPAEIVTKKLFFRAIDFQVRDIFDTACILKREPDVLFNELDVFSSKLDILEERVKCVSSFYAKQAKEMVIEPSEEFIGLLSDGPERMISFIQDCKKIKDMGIRYLR